MLSDYGEVFENVSLENYNTYGIKVKTKYLIKPDTINHVKDLINYLDKEGMPYYLLGKGSNVILPDNDFEGVIISLENLNKIIIDDYVVKAECGVILSKLVREVINNNLKGLETLGTIPGTLGGALYGNASFYKDKSIYDYLVSVLVLEDNELKVIERKDIKIGHRYSSFKERKVILLEATFELIDGIKEEMEEEIKICQEKRLKTQPTDKRNAGSVFKNPEGYAAGKLIQDAHLKGYTIGGAQVSEKHANFIVNLGGATSKDIKDLIKVIKEKVYEDFKVNLELEQIVIEW